MCKWLRVRTCECVSCVASHANAQKAGCAVLKAPVGVGAGEHRRVSMIPPENQGEGGRVFILSPGMLANPQHITVYTLTGNFLYSTVKH